jgi:hypothetical protein
MKRALEEAAAAPEPKLPRIEEEPVFMLGRLRFEGRPKDVAPLVLMDPSRPARAVFTHHFLIGLTEPVRVCLERTGLVAAETTVHPPIIIIPDEDAGADKDMESDYVPPPPLPEEFSGDDGSASRSGSSSASQSGSSSSDADESPDGASREAESVIDEEDALAAADVDAGDSGHDDHALFSVYATTLEERQQLAAFIAHYQPPPTGFVNALLAALLYLAGADDPLLVERFAAEFPLLPENPVAALKLMAGMHYTIDDFTHASMTILRAGIAEEEEDSL